MVLNYTVPKKLKDLMNLVAYKLISVVEGNIKGGIEVTGIRGRRRRKLLDELKERRGYFPLKEEALDRTMRRARFGKGFDLS
jgi:hypothetical protein